MSRETPPPAVGASAGAFRQEILDVLAGLLQETALDQLRITQILRAAKVSRGTFYFYYAGKEDAFAALLDQVYARVVPKFEALFADPGLGPPALREGIAAWLAFEGSDGAVIRAAVEEWPRHAGIREIHLAAQRRLAAAVTRGLEGGHKAGVATTGLPAATLGSALVWTLERAWYEASDVSAVSEALAATIEAAVHGGTA